MTVDRRFYSHGAEVHAAAAKHIFRDFNSAASDAAEIDGMWEQCLTDEAARDDWFPAHLEMITESL